MLRITHSSAALGVLGEPPSPVARLSGRPGYRALLHDGYVDAVKVRPREAPDQAAARAFLARHDSLWAARLGELVHPLDHPALVAETAGWELLGMLTYLPWRGRAGRVALAGQDAPSSRCTFCSISSVFIAKPPQRRWIRPAASTGRADFVACDMP